MAYGHVFEDPKKKAEMLAYRAAGYSYLQLACYYGVDHSTLIYHCRKAGMVVPMKGDSRDKILELIKKGKTIKEVSKELNILESTISTFLSKEGVKGFKIVSNKKLLVLSLPCPMTRNRNYIKSQISYKRTPPPRPGWSRVGDEWISNGKNFVQILKDCELRKKKMLEEARIKMLIY